jgi:hypothetical protein
VLLFCRFLWEYMHCLWRYVDLCGRTVLSFGMKGRSRAAVHLKSVCSSVRIRNLISVPVRDVLPGVLSVYFDQ